MKTHAIIAVLALSAALVACGERADSPIKTGTTGSLNNPAANVPAAAPDRDSPPAQTPATHAAAPQPETPAVPTARDTPAMNPTGTLTKAEEAYAMPKPGQTDNHHTTSLEGDLKGTQQSPGNTPPPAANTPPASDTPAASPSK